MAPAVRIKRVYDPPSGGDGRRILVDRLWPRGVSREKARIDSWMKELAPSSELRTWFQHDPDKWPEFVKRYRAELKGKAALVSELRAAAAGGTMTLLFAAKDEEHNNAVVLRGILVRKGKQKP
ncbi:MAG TPA: DUF488 domain-containing protein [Nitrospirota bacterium]